VPDVVVRQMLASAVQIVVHCSRLGDGSRKLTAISEVTGVEDGQVEMQDVFVLDRTGASPGGRVQGAFRATGIRPAVLHRLHAYGVRLPESVFAERHELKGA
jgi:pilus assembly protein CpaF